MEKEPSHGFRHASAQLNQFVKHQADTVYREARLIAVGAFMDGTALSANERRIGERRQGIDRRQDMQRKHKDAACDERRRVERRHGLERRLTI